MAAGFTFPVFSSIRPWRSHHVANYELQAERSLANALDALGMTPTSRAKLGLDLQRTVASAEETEAARVARERLDHRAETIDAEATE